VGDGAMIIFFWIAAAPAGRCFPHACCNLSSTRIYYGLRVSIMDWIVDLPPAAKERLSVRIGGHFGPAVVSRLGPAHHQHITATGDTVNVTRGSLP
jgi:adenylate cyclase